LEGWGGKRLSRKATLLRGKGRGEKPQMENESGKGKKLVKKNSLATSPRNEEEFERGSAGKDREGQPGTEGEEIWF